MTYEEKQTAQAIRRQLTTTEWMKDQTKSTQKAEQGAALFRAYQNGERDAVCGVSEWTGPEFDAEGPYYECKACEGGLRGKTPFCPWCGRRMLNHTYTLKDC